MLEKEEKESKKKKSNKESNKESTKKSDQELANKSSKNSVEMFQKIDNESKKRIY